MATTTFYRKANISSAEATASIAKSFPTAELVSFAKKAATAEEAQFAGAKVGDEIYAATVRTADFPPSDDSGSDDQDSGAPKKEEGGESDSGDEGKDDSAPDFTKDEGAGESPDEGGEEKPKLKGDDGIIALLQELVGLVKGGDSGLGPDAGLDGPDAGGPAGLPDVGSPVPGAPDGGLGAGPAGPAGPGAPLPPPIKPKAPMGAGAFAHYDPTQPVFSTIRVNAGELTTAEIKKQAEEVYPTHQVAKIQRSGKAKLGHVGKDDAEVYDLAKNKVAVITLVAK